MPPYESDEEQEGSAEQVQPKDIKLGEIELKSGAVLVIKKTNYKGQDRIDFRVWLNTAKYKGPTKQGFQLLMDKVDEFVEIVGAMKEKLGRSAPTRNLKDNFSGRKNKTK